MMWRDLFSAGLILVESEGMGDTMGQSNGLVISLPTCTEVHQLGCSSFLFKKKKKKSPCPQGEMQENAEV